MELRINLTRDISDSLLFKLAFMGNVPALELYTNRAKRKKALVNNKLRLRKALSQRGIPLSLIETPSPKLVKELTKWHTFLGDIPLSSLVNPLNTNRTNLKLLQEKKLIKDIYYGINLKKIKLIGDLLDSRDMSTVITSVVWLNWFLKNHTSQRPNSPNLDFLYREESGGTSLSVNFISSLDENLKKELKLLVNIMSHELIALVNSYSDTVLRRLQNMYHLHIETSKSGEIKWVLPSYTILREDNIENLVIIEKLHLLGYKNLNHLVFLDRRITPYLFDKNFIEKVKKL